MKTIDHQLDPSAENECLGQVEALQDSILATLLALGDASLETLEESLWKQQLFCATLEHSLVRLRSSVDEISINRLGPAMEALHALSGTYAAAVDQARNSTDLLLKLSEAYRSVHPAELNAGFSSEVRRSRICTA